MQSPRRPDEAALSRAAASLASVKAQQARRAAAVRPTNRVASRISVGVAISGGFWGERLRVNRETTLPHGYEQLRRAGNFHNLRLAAGEQGRYESLGAAQGDGRHFPFLDSDVYKWLEAAGWELGRGADETLAAAADEAIGLIEAAQRPDGYVNSYVQVVGGGREYEDLAWGHEMYCAGHLTQAAIAWRRALGDDRLLDVAVRAVDHLERAFGSRGRAGVDGHPGIEMALVELFRETGERRHLDLAARFVDSRGRGILGPGRFGAPYWQDHLPVRDAPDVAGHAVRQLYLDCAAVDLATELGDERLLEAVRRRWHDMLATRTYLTGGLGSRHRDESFGDPYELPPDRAYAETCAAIASVMLGWRLMLATGDPGYADAIERALFNAVLPGVSLDGTSFFYVNALQRRTRRAGAEPGHGERQAWFPCACCPPNLMRLISSLEGYVATVDEQGIQLHQYVTGIVEAGVAAGTVRLALETGYPWDGRVDVTILESVEEPWELSLRMPGWCRSVSVTVGSDETIVPAAGQIRAERAWRSGDRLAVTFEMPARITHPDPRIDAVRGCVALERGPLVYCLETADLPAGMELEQVALEPPVQAEVRPRPDIAPDLVGLKVPALRLDPGSASSGREAVDVGAVPYFAWANRGAEAMRVWIPLRDRAEPRSTDGR